MVKTKTLLSSPNLRLTGVGFALFITISVIVSAFLNGQRIHDLSDWVEHTRRVQTHVQEVQTLLVDMESSLRGYALTKAPSFTQAYERASAQIPISMQELRELTRDNAAQQANIDQATALLTEELTQLQRWKDAISTGNADMSGFPDIAQDESALMIRLR